jgi:hypothetical protein
MVEGWLEITALGRRREEGKGYRRTNMGPQTSARSLSELSSEIITSSWDVSQLVRLTPLRGPRVYVVINAAISKQCVVGIRNAGTVACVEGPLLCTTSNKNAPIGNCGWILKRLLLHPLRTFPKTRIATTEGCTQCDVNIFTNAFHI